MKVWVGSDLHFSHANILKFNPATRQFRDVNHMDAEMVRMWNEKVGTDDLVYILGDIAFCNAEKAVGFLNHMNGSKCLIVGNHDKKLLKSPNFVKCFKDIKDYKEIEHNGHKLVLFHFPIFDHAT